MEDADITREIEALRQYTAMLERIAHENKHAGPAYGAADVLSDVEDMPDEYADEIEQIFQGYSGEELERELFAFYDDNIRDCLLYDEVDAGPGGDGTDPDADDRDDNGDDGSGGGEGPENGPGDGPDTDGDLEYDFELGFLLDEPDEYRRNTTWLLGDVAGRQMERKGYASVPRYDVVVAGDDAQHVIDEYIDGFEIEIYAGNDRERSVDRLEVDPGEFRPADEEVLDELGYDEDDTVQLWRAPDHLEDMVSDSSLLGGKSWADSFEPHIRPIDDTGDYVGRRP